MRWTTRATWLAVSLAAIAGCDGQGARDPYLLERPFEVLRSCQAEGDPCAAFTPDGGLHAGYRKDRYLPLEAYPTELTDLPLDGGRFHLAGVSAVTGTVTGVRLDGVDVQALLVEPSLEWYHVWPERVVAGAPVWLAFHSRDPAWDAGRVGALRIETDQGTALGGSFRAEASPLEITYLAPEDTGGALLVHARNASAATRRITRVLLDGRDVSAAGLLCAPRLELAPGEHALWRLPLCAPPAAGSAWTLVVELEDAPAAVAVGRHLRPFFPIEAWQKGEDCPLPGVNDEALALFQAAGLDTFYLYWGSGARCGYDNHEMLEGVLPARGDVHVLLGDDFPFADPPSAGLADTRAIAGFLTGDESDWDLYDEQGVPRASLKAADTRGVWRHHPELLTYNGAMTDKHIGVFAGMADVQGIDVYAAGCAPHAFVFGHFPPLRAPYDFLRNARLNHMPWPTWLYAQGLADWVPGPDASEILIQALEVMAAGGKGLMWFQAGVRLAAEQPAEWRALADASWLHRAVRHLLRVADPTGLARSDPDTLVEALRAPEALVIPVISLRSETVVTDEACLEFQLGASEEEPHWRIEERRVSLEVDVPDDLALVEAFEVLPTGVSPVAAAISRAGRRLTLADIPVSPAQPVHLYVLAAHPGVRAGVEAELARRPGPGPLEEPP